jgi:hypothetical protein
MGRRALLAQLVEHLHGKEGVDGSSPSEGFTERPAKRLLELSQWETTVTRGHSRALPGVPSSGVSAGGIRLDQAHPNRIDPLCTTQGPAESARHIEMSGKGDAGVAHVSTAGIALGRTDGPSSALNLSVAFGESDNVYAEMILFTSQPRSGEPRLPISDRHPESAHSFGDWTTTAGVSGAGAEAAVFGEAGAAAGVVALAVVLRRACSPRGGGGVRVRRLQVAAGR